MAPTVAAIVPMRHESERVPGKNYRVLSGRPLFHHILSTLSAVRAVTEIVIDTDSDLIRDDAVQAFPDVVVLDRPAHLRGGMVPMNDVLLNDVDRIAADFYLQTHSTNPLLTAESISRGVDRFLATRPDYDSLFSVTRLQTRLWTADGTPLNHDPGVLLRTQDLPPVFEENSCLYLFSAETLRQRRNRIGERPLLFELSPEEAWDIDEETDWIIAEALYERQRRK